MTSASCEGNGNSQSSIGRSRTEPGRPVAKRNFLRLAVCASLAQLALFGFLVTAARPAAAEDAAVKIDNFTFVPKRMTVKAGTTVTWINEDDIPHAIASTGNAFRSKVLDTEDKFSFTFTTPGTFEYFCSLHPHMTATIVVEAATGSNAAP
jgi:plastocyanin